MKDTDVIAFTCVRVAVSWSLDSRDEDLSSCGASMV
jgi:hypothetical protein